MKNIFGDKIIQLLDKTNQLSQAGWKKKRISEELGIFPSVLSVLVNRIGYELLAIQENRSLTDTDVSNVFKDINNISENKLRRNIDTYITKLDQLKNITSGDSLNNYIQDLERTTPYEKLLMFCGIYDCYYLSSINYKIKREPLIISKNIDNESMWVQKGNNMGPTKLKGILYTSNNHIITIQVKEDSTVVPDQFIAHFSLPPSYQSIQLLKGISVSFSNSYLPISRKVVLKQISSSTSLNEFNKIETRFFDKEEANSDRIVNYLYSQNSLMEYYHIPRPSFDEKDLDTELKILKVNS